MREFYKVAHVNHRSPHQIFNFIPDNDQTTVITYVSRCFEYTVALNGLFKQFLYYRVYFPPMQFLLDKTAMLTDHPVQMVKIV